MINTCARNYVYACGCMHTYMYVCTPFVDCNCINVRKEDRKIDHEDNDFGVGFDHWMNYMRKLCFVRRIDSVPDL